MDVGKQTKVVPRAEGDKFLHFGGGLNETEFDYGPFFNTFGMDKETEFIASNMNGLLGQVLSGYHIVIFGYGYSGAGKSCTLLNGSKKSKSLTVLALEQYFEAKATVEIRKIFELYVEQGHGLNMDNPVVTWETFSNKHSSR